VTTTRREPAGVVGDGVAAGVGSGVAVVGGTPAAPLRDSSGDGLAEACGGGVLGDADGEPFVAAGGLGVARGVDGGAVTGPVDGSGLGSAEECGLLRVATKIVAAMSTTAASATAAIGRGGRPSALPPDRTARSAAPISDPDA
jgi:hypothetical protein